MSEVPVCRKCSHRWRYQRSSAANRCFSSKERLVTNLVTFSGLIGDFDMTARIVTLSQRAADAVVDLFPPLPKEMLEMLETLSVQAANRTWVAHGLNITTVID